MEWVRVVRPDPKRNVVRLVFLGVIPLGPTILAVRYAWHPDQALPRWLRRWRQLRWGRELDWWHAAALWLHGEGG